MTNLGGTGVSENTDFDDEITELLDRQDRLNPATLAIWQDDTSAQLDDVVTTAERSTGNGGGGTGDVIASGTETGFKIVKHNTLPLSWELRVDDEHIVDQFGSIGNDIIVDTLALQATIDDAPTGGIVRGNTSKTYLSSGLVINKELTLKDITLHADTDTTNALVYVTADNVKLERVKTIIVKAEIVASDCSGVLVEGVSSFLDTFEAIDCEFDGSKNDNYTQPFIHAGLLLVDADNVSVTGCTVRNTDKEGMIIASGNNASFIHCHAYDTGFSGIGSTGSTGFKHVGLLIQSCTVANSGASGITANSENSVVTGNYVLNHKNNNGINIGHPSINQPARNCSCTGNVVEVTIAPLTTANGIRINSSEGTVVTGNTVKGRDLLDVGIYSDTAKTISINSNTVEGCSTGIKVAHDRVTSPVILPDAISVVGNLIQDMLVIGIQMSAARYANISNNTIEHFGRGGSGSSSGIFLTLSAVLSSKAESVNIVGNIIADGGFCIRADTAAPFSDGYNISNNMLNQFDTTVIGKDGAGIFTGNGNIVNNAPSVVEFTFANAATTVTHNNANIDPDIGIPEISINGAWVHTDELYVSAITAGQVELKRTNSVGAQTVKIVIR